MNWELDYMYTDVSLLLLHLFMNHSVPKEMIRHFGYFCYLELVDFGAAWIPSPGTPLCRRDHYITVTGYGRS